MEKRSKGVRKKTLKGATVVFNGAGTITCTVRNLSNSGALLQVESAVGIPEQFKLYIETDDSERQCRVVWRKYQKIGVQFFD